MTKSELIEELLKMSGDAEVWIDTDFGLKPAEMVYDVMNDTVQTIIITYADKEFENKTIN